jgi:hypothetical protein
MSARFVGTGSFLIRFSNGYTKQTHSQIKKSRDHLKKITNLIKKNQYLQSSHYRNVCTIPLELVADPLGSHEHTFGNDCVYHAVFETQNRQYPTSQANVAVLRLICIRNLPGSNLGRDIDYSDFYFSWFSSVCLTKCWDTPSLGHAVFLPSPLQISGYHSSCLPRLTPLCTTPHTGSF